MITQKRPRSLGFVYPAEEGLPGRFDLGKRGRVERVWPLLTTSRATTFLGEFLNTKTARERERDAGRSRRVKGEERDLVNAGAEGSLDAPFVGAADGREPTGAREEVPVQDGHLVAARSPNSQPGIYISGEREISRLSRDRAGRTRGVRPPSASGPWAADFVMCAGLSHTPHDSSESRL